MKIVFEYCKVCNYMPIAGKLAMDIKSEYECEIDYIAGKNGVFNVIVDGNTVYSKDELGRLPNKGEIMDIIKEIA